VGLAETSSTNLTEEPWLHWYRVRKKNWDNTLPFVSNVFLLMAGSCGMAFFKSSELFNGVK
jgi:hypothetical protein